MKSRKLQMMICLLALAICLPALASAKPVIDAALPNYSTMQLTVTGSGFGTGIPVVKLDGTALTVVSHSATQIVTTLPSASGSFELTVEAGSATGTFDLSLGVTGPQGPQGAQGPQGPAGVELAYSALNYTGEALGSVDGGTAVAIANEIATTGYYSLSGSAIINDSAGDTVYCWINSLFNGLVSTYGETASYQTNIQTVSMVGTPYLHAGDQLIMYCGDTYGNNSSFEYNAGFTAALVNTLNQAQAKQQAKKKVQRPMPLN
jgi:IPT/TIG domain